MVALVGNPNTGKTTLFNALTGFHRHVANYPGVTVEVGRGSVRGTAIPIELLDLPGTYSLAAVSPDETIVADVLAGRMAGGDPPKAILAIVDASNLARNLYLVSQLLELERPLVIALNMVDVARGRGIAADEERLAQRLGVPIVPTVAVRDEGVEPLVRALEASVDGPAPRVRAALPPVMRAAALSLRDAAPAGLTEGEALRVLLDRGGHAERQYFERGGSAQQLVEARERLRAAGVMGTPTEARARYAWIQQILDGVITRPPQPVRTWSDRLDRILLHKLGGGLILVAVLMLVFQSLFSWASPLMGGIEWLFATLGTLVADLVPPGALQSLLVDGLIAGVGGVLAFLPQIMLLFLFIAVLEDCGYMARAAYIMDRLMRTIGLSGRAFIPLLSSFACAVPAIMGARAIADRRERFVTTLIIPFMSCSARLPVYVLMIAALVPPTRVLGGWLGLQGLVMLGMYLVGVIVAIPIAWLLKGTVFAGPPPGFVLELPSYKSPRLRTVWQRIYLAGKEFVVRAGTIILAVSLVVWALGYFPRSGATLERVRARAAVEGWAEDVAHVEREAAGAYVRESYLARIGQVIEPVIQPLGWDWRIGMAVVASFPAREVVVATLGTIYNLGGQEDERSVSLRTAIRSATWPDSGKKVFTLPVALSIMVFFALCAQCTSTLVIMGRELRSWVWPVLSFLGMTTIAYFTALLTAVVARSLGF